MRKFFFSLRDDSHVPDRHELKNRQQNAGLDDVSNPTWRATIGNQRRSQIECLKMEI